MGSPLRFPKQNMKKRQEAIDESQCSCNLRWCHSFSPALSVVNCARSDSSLCLGLLPIQRGASSPPESHNFNFRWTAISFLAYRAKHDDIPPLPLIQFTMHNCPRMTDRSSTSPLSLSLAFEMAPNYGSPNAEQVLALSCTVVGVGPGGNTSMVA